MRKKLLVFNKPFKLCNLFYNWAVNGKLIKLAEDMDLRVGAPQNRPYKGTGAFYLGNENQD